MKATKKKTVGAVSELNNRIDACIVLQQQIDAIKVRLDAERAGVKEILVSNKLDRYATATGNEALIIEKTAFTWNPDALQGALSEGDFEELCPRKPAAENLRKRMESDKDFAKRVKKCFKKKTPTKSLELRAKGQAESSEKVTPIEDAA